MKRSASTDCAPMYLVARELVEPLRLFHPTPTPTPAPGHHSEDADPWCCLFSNQMTRCRMSNYQRVYQPGGCYFFTVVTHNRQPLLTAPAAMVRLRAAFSHVAKTRPFTVVAAVVLPDHLHCLWQLPEGDTDFSTRWRLIKHYVAVGCKQAANGRREKLFWQRRFWEHLIRDEADWRCHVDYIHYNPVKHGLVKSPGEWAHGTFRRYGQEGWYPPDWGMNEPEGVGAMALD